MGKFRTELQRLCETTTVKGVPRVIKAPRRVLRILWTGSTLVFFGLATWQVTLLVIQYLQFSYVTLLTEERLREKPTEEFAMCPAITICNLNPFTGNASSLIQSLGLPGLQAFSELVLDVTNCTDCSGENKKLLHRVRNDLLTSHGYYTYIGKEMALQLAHQRDDLILDCHMHLREGFRSYKEQCNINADMEPFTDFSFFKCWILNAAVNTSINHPQTGVGLALHLDNHFGEHYDYLNMRHDYGQHLGALVVVHEPGTPPMLRRDSYYLPPGGFFDIKVDITHHTREPNPYGDCREAPLLLEGTSWRYSVDGCISVCMEKKIADQCKCRSLFTLNLMEDTFAGLPYCANPAVGTAALLENSICDERIREFQYQECEEECPHACEETKYTPKISQAVWPPDPFHDIFYDDYVRNRTYEFRYTDLSKYIQSSTGTHLEKEYLRSLVSRNFLHADIYVGSNTYLRLTDTPKITPSGFLSQLGGMLNLFAGISIVIVSEIIDALIRLCLKDPEKPKRISVMSLTSTRY